MSRREEEREDKRGKQDKSETVIWRGELGVLCLKLGRVGMQCMVCQCYACVRDA
jgi:hypothetical protein